MASISQLRELRGKGYTEDQIARILAGEEPSPIDSPRTKTVALQASAQHANIYPPYLDSYPSERELQAAVVEQLEARNWEVIQMYLGSDRGGSVWADKGIPDLWCARMGREVWIELKQPGNGPTEAQVKMHQKIRRGGGVVYVCYSVSEVLWVMEGERI